MNNEKTLLQTRFERLYKGCVLFAIQLNGFSHKVIYKDADGLKHIDAMSACAPEQYTPASVSMNVSHSFNLDKTKVLFLGFPHYEYQGNATEYVYKDVKEW